MTARRHWKLAALVALALTPAPALLAQEEPAGRPSNAGPLDADGYTTRYVQLGARDSEGLLFEPARETRNGIALIYTHPGSNNFGAPVGRQMARRGYRAMMVNYRGPTTTPDRYLPTLSRAIGYLRSLPGVRKVVLVGHSGGGHLVAFYENVAENGPGACSGPEKIYPCDTKLVAGLARPDGIVLLDPTLGAAHQATAIDPARAESPRSTCSRRPTAMTSPPSAPATRRRSPRASMRRRRRRIRASLPRRRPGCG